MPPLSPCLKTTANNGWPAMCFISSTLLVIHVCYHPLPVHLPGHHTVYFLLSPTLPHPQPFLLVASLPPRLHSSCWQGSGGIKHAFSWPTSCPIILPTQPPYCYLLHLSRSRHLSSTSLVRSPTTPSTLRLWRPGLSIHFAGHVV